MVISDAILTGPTKECFRTSQRLPDKNGCHGRACCAEVQMEVRCSEDEMDGRRGGGVRYVNMDVDADVDAAMVVWLLMLRI
jgi:hypothetical protein